MTKTLKPAGLLVAFLLTGCLGGGSTPTATTAPANNQTPPPPAQAISSPIKGSSDRFVGTYNGVLPCIDCDGLQTSLTLDGLGHYTIQSIKLGKKIPPHNASGLYRLTPDKQYLQLDKNANLTFFVGEDFLEVRLPDGSKGERPFPEDNYRLKR